MSSALSVNKISINFKLITKLFKKINSLIKAVKKCELNIRTEYFHWNRGKTCTRTNINNRRI